MNQLKKALQLMLEEFTPKNYDLYCDHSAGICACSALRTIETANAAMESKDELDGLYTELIASILLFPPNDEYKKGFNDAMNKAVRFVKMYQKGEGLFQS